MKNVKWLVDNGFPITVAGRSLIEEEQETAIQGYNNTFKEYDIPLTLDQNNLGIFAEMIQNEDVPEITTSCWGILNVSPDDQMCASERMIVKRKGAERPVVLPCTLLTDDTQFELGHTLKDSDQRVYLNHEFCAKFCVLGGCSCSEN